MSLDKDNKVVRFSVHWKFLSIKNVDLSQEVRDCPPEYERAL